MTHFYLVIFLLFVHRSMNTIGCDEEYNSKTGEILTPVFSNSSGEINCLWTISLNGTDNISLLFIRLITNKSSILYHKGDIFQVYDVKPTQSSVPLWSLNQTFGSGYQIQIDRNKIWIVFSLKGISKERVRLTDVDYEYKILYTSFSFDEPCEDIGYITNGRRLGDTFYNGFSVRFKCDFGYRLDGTNQIFCESPSSTSSWSHNKPVCLPTCAKPNVPSRGFITNPSEHYLLNFTLTFDCWQPYTLERNWNIKCVLSQEGQPQWNINSPKCIEICQPPYFRNATENSGSIVAMSQNVNPPNASCHWIIETSQNSIVNIKLVNINFTENIILDIFDTIRLNNKVLLARINTSDYEDNIGSSFNSSGNRVEVKLTIPKEERAVTKTTKGYDWVSKVTDDTNEPTLFVSASTLLVPIGPTITYGTLKPTGSDVNVGVIVGGVIAVVLAIVLFLAAVYIWYRKKYPVRMIMGKDFGKFTNPAYPKTRTNIALVRDEESGHAAEYDNPAMVNSTMDLSKDNVDGVENESDIDYDSNKQEKVCAKIIRYSIDQNKLILETEKNEKFSTKHQTNESTIVKVKSRNTPVNTNSDDVNKRTRIRNWNKNASHVISENESRNSSDGSFGKDDEIIESHENYSDKSMPNNIASENTSSDDGGNIKNKNWKRSPNNNESGDASYGSSEHHYESVNSLEKGSMSSTTMSNVASVIGLDSEFGNARNLINEKRRTLQFFHNADSVSNMSVGNGAGIVMGYTDSDTDEVIETCNLRQNNLAEAIKKYGATSKDNGVNGDVDLTGYEQKSEHEITSEGGECSKSVAIPLVCKVESNHELEQDEIQEVEEASDSNNEAMANSESFLKSFSDRETKNIEFENEFRSDSGNRCNDSKRETREVRRNKDDDKMATNQVSQIRVAMDWSRANRFCSYSDNSDSSADAGPTEFRSVSVSCNIENDSNVKETNEVYMEASHEEIDEGPACFLRRSLSGNRTFKEYEWMSIGGISYSPSGTFIGEDGNIDKEETVINELVASSDSNEMPDSHAITGFTSRELPFTLNDERQISYVSDEYDVEISDISSDVSHTDSIAGEFTLENKPESDQFSSNESRDNSVSEYDFEKDNYQLDFNGKLENENVILNTVKSKQSPTTLSGVSSVDYSLSGSPRENDNEVSSYGQRVVSGNLVTVKQTIVVSHEDGERDLIYNTNLQHNAQNPTSPSRTFISKTQNDDTDNDFDGEDFDISISISSSNENEEHNCNSLRRIAVVSGAIDDIFEDNDHDCDGRTLSHGRRALSVEMEELPTIHEEMSVEK